MSEYKQQAVACYCFVLNSKHEFLTVQRAPNDSRPGLWEMPGGSLDFAEEPVLGAQRETLEEAGIKVIAYTPIATKSGFSTRKSNFQVIRIAYFSKMVDESEKVVLSHEHSDYKWLSIDSLPSLDYSTLLLEVLENKKLILGLDLIFGQ